MHVDVSSAKVFLLGCHLSIAKGFSAAVDDAVSLGNTALQIFTHSPSTWRMRALATDEVDRFRSRREASPIRYLAVHAMYLINLATPDVELYERSITAMADEMKRAACIGADAVVAHVGHRMDLSQKRATKRVAAALTRVLTETGHDAPSTPRLLLENTAGAGSAVGSSFDELARILSLIEDDPRVDVCLDTCHAHVAGYDLSTVDAVNDAVQTLDRVIGLERLSLVHLNDARFAAGSHRDRHGHIGRGTIANEGIAAIVNHDALSHLPFILETPKTFEDGTEADPTNLSVVRDLRGAG